MRSATRRHLRLLRPQYPTMTAPGRRPRWSPPERLNPSCSEMKGLAVSSLAHWCHRHRKLVLTGWAVLLVGLAAAVLSIGTAFTSATNLPNSESATAYSLLGTALPASTSTTTGTIAWHATGVAIDDPAVQRQVDTMLTKVRAVPGVALVVSPYTAAGAQQRNPGAGTAYARVVLARDSDVKPVAHLVAGFRTGTLDVTYGGTAFSQKPSPSHGMEAIGVLAALALLLLVFRSLWAAVLPIVTGVVGVGTSLLVVILGSHKLDLDSTSLTMGALIGLGVGIDYALFIVNRTRKALLAGASVPEAIAEAIDTSGRAVVFAGLTVVIALLGMFVVRLDVLTGMGRAAAVSVILTVLAAITLLPALLGCLGLRVLSQRQRDTLALGQTTRANRKPRHGLGWHWARLVQFLPKTMGTLALLVIIALASPVVAMRIGDSDASSDPAGSQTHQYFTMVSTAFGSGFDATLLLVAATPDPASATAFTTLVGNAKTVAHVAAVTPVTVSTDGTIAYATVVPTTSAQTRTTSDLVAHLRDRVIPRATHGTRLRVYVGGATATSIDLSDALMGRLPLYLGMVALLCFLLLAMAFRSVLVPLVGAITNLTTIMVGLGAITAIFQLGYGSQVFNVGSNAPVMYIVPVIIVGVICGLSMDYQVFLVSRMHEEWASTHDNRRAVKIGLSETAQVIATAATIMLAVFASFSFTGERIVSAIGIGLASAVLVDAFVVRLTLVPAIMTVLGQVNWSYPRWAEWITPRVSVEGSRAVSSTDADQARLIGDDHELGPVPCAEFGHGAVGVGLGGDRTDVELGRDVVVG